MKLQETLPGGVTVKGHFYRMDFDFRNVLRMMDCLARDDLLPDARAFIALKCLMKRPPRNADEVLAATREIIFPETKKHADKQKITDFVQDADMIRAAFLQAYGINLFRDRLHWLEFSSLLSCLPEGSRYSEVLGIRSRPLPAPTKWNAEERRSLIQAKAAYALEMSEKEQENNYMRCVINVFAGMKAMAEKGGGEHA